MQTPDVSPEPAFLQATQPYFLQLFFIRHVFYTLPHLHWPLWICSSTSMSFLKWVTQNCAWGATSLVMSRARRSPSYSYWPHYSWYRPRCPWSPGHTDGSSIHLSVNPQSLSPEQLSSCTPPACSDAWGCCSPGAGPIRTMAVGREYMHH